MEAFIVKNVTSHKVLLRGVNPMVPKLELKGNTEHLFATPQEYMNFRPELEKLIHAKFVVVETVKQVSNKSYSTGRGSTDTVKPLAKKATYVTKVEDVEEKRLAKFEDKVDEMNSDLVVEETSAGYSVEEAPDLTLSKEEGDDLTKRTLMKELKKLQARYKELPLDERKPVKEEILVIKEKLKLL
jgi:hypothetical protein